MKTTVLALAASFTMLGAAHASTTINYGSPVVVDPLGSGDDFGYASPFLPSITVDDIETITNLTVSIEGLTHDSWRDVDWVLAIGPAGGNFASLERGIVLRSGNSFDFSPVAVTNVDLTFDENASEEVPLENLVSGTYRPTDRYDYIANSYFTDFLGMEGVTSFAELIGSATGSVNLSLFVYDYFNDDNIGSFTDWSVTFDTLDTAEVPVPGVGIAAGLAAAAFLRRKRA
ncbi:hypothetical protein [Parvularcula maris]|uniref:PEP-CTERM sorting domain-containing protein n=1 Tax=Parvularcula maris TaxID=2965077 RepID=A0A9X2RJF0_9PROT|nr:hypothetical protein [Parvularcula maris]MCQ8184682.1 hypothetical protein [Parvularcula maris]